MKIKLIFPFFILLISLISSYRISKIKDKDIDKLKTQIIKHYKEKDNENFCKYFEEAKDLKLKNLSFRNKQKIDIIVNEGIYY